MNKKLAMSLTSIGLAVGIMGASTLAWFTSEDSTKAHFNTGTVKVAVSPKEDADSSIKFKKTWVPGDKETRPFIIENKGTSDIYVRAKLEGEWENKELDNKNVDIDISGKGQWIKGEDGWYYYNLTIRDREDMFINMKLDGKSTDDSYQEQKYNLNCHVEAIQVDKAQNISKVWKSCPYKK